MTTRKTILFGFLFIIGLVGSTVSNAEENTQAKKHVTLNVIAFDDKDHVVGDLTSKDFQVIDEGKPQPITFFRHDEHQSPVVILFDLLNQGMGAQGNSSKQVIHALEHSESGDTIYFYLLTREAKLQALRALPNPKAPVDESGGAWTAHIRPLLEAAMNSVAATRQDYNNDIARTNQLIGALGKEMSSIPDRKYMIWVSQCPAQEAVASGPLGVDQQFSHDLSNPEREECRGEPSAIVTRFSGTLDNEGITLNIVDLGSPVSRGGAAFDDFAKVTGGKVYHNDFDKALAETVSASHSSYIIQYDAPPSDGKLHKIRVTSTRRGVHLQFKQEYVANP